MRPSGVFCKISDKQRRCDRPAPPGISDIFQIGKIALKFFFVIFRKRQTPAAFIGFLSGRDDGFSQFVVKRKGPGNLFPQGHDTGAGQCGQVDQGFGFVGFNGIGDGIDEYQPAFCVRVSDLDGFSGIRLNDIAGPGRGSRRHVLHNRQQPHNIYLRFELCQGYQGGGNSGRTGHIRFHGIQRSARFQIDAARIKSNPFSHKGDGFLCAPRTIFHDHQTGFVPAPGRHRQHGAEFFFLKRFFIQYGDFKIFFGGSLGDRFCKLHRWFVIGRYVDPFPGNKGSLADGLDAGARF